MNFFILQINNLISHKVLAFPQIVSHKQLTEGLDYNLGLNSLSSSDLQRNYAQISILQWKTTYSTLSSLCSLSPAFFMCSASSQTITCIRLDVCNDFLLQGLCSYYLHQEFCIFSMTACLRYCLFHKAQPRYAFSSNPPKLSPPSHPSQK